MSYKDLREVREYYTALRELVIQNNGGWDDVESRAKMARLSGADYLRLQILIVLEALNTRLFFIDALRNRASLQHQEEPLPREAG